MGTRSGLFAILVVLALAQLRQSICLKVMLMKWQEYQEAVGELYDQLDNLGIVSRSVTMPDKVTGQPRQIDVLVEIEAFGHSLRVIVDAKFRADKIDVKDVEEVLALSKAVGGSKTVMVAANGWTEPAAKKAEFEEWGYGDTADTANSTGRLRGHSGHSQ